MADKSSADPRGFHLLKVSSDHHLFPPILLRERRFPSWLSLSWRWRNCYLPDHSRWNDVPIEKYKPLSHLFTTYESIGFFPTEAEGGGLTMDYGWTFIDQNMEGGSEGKLNSQSELIMVMLQQID